ncbi:transposase [Novosphingobium sp. SG751A]|uniref:IS66-like element accessory protein TnpA n=1 Tax=Novosphingobium sp. SG751A TaxID=2587000 RepID=UPI001C12B2A2|nr:transposase [Novosphingobium sp. SG751A]NOW49040.1 transposase [Novosphingobium sp. SG751A]
MALDDGISGQTGVVSVSRNGKRRYDPIWKERLITAALEPGVSIARLALEHGVNANQLRNWVKVLRDRQGVWTPKGVRACGPSVFVPVVEAAPTARPPASPCTLASPVRLQLKASLPNGVLLELANADAQALSVFIEVLGRCNVPAR